MFFYQKTAKKAKKATKSSYGISTLRLYDQCFMFFYQKTGESQKQP